ncbi:MAG: TerB family tellurite resistance protein [Bacteroidaceae bacterium]|nr:TerB family tellurite resistance protein [Bacteroidaceae bacterium]
MALGKWIGGFLGLLHGGPLGALAGFALGALFDSMTERAQSFTVEEERTYQSQGERNGFLFSLMVLSAHIIHADGRIMHSEMEFVRRFLRTNFSSQAESEGQEILLRLFEEKKQMGAERWNAQMRAICQQLRVVMPAEQRIQLIAFLCEIAKADGSIATEERNALQQICIQMGLEGGTAEQMMGLGGSTLEEAYQVLGISPDATDDEVRRAYKKMALENHPDRVATLGDDIKAAAEKKFQKIGEAKDRIFKARGMK